MAREIMPWERGSSTPIFDMFGSRDESPLVRMAREEQYNRANAEEELKKMAEADREARLIGAMNLRAGQGLWGAPPESEIASPNIGAMQEEVFGKFGVLPPGERELGSRRSWAGPKQTVYSQGTTFERTPQGWNPILRPGDMGPSAEPLEAKNIRKLADSLDRKYQTAWIEYQVAHAADPQLFRESTRNLRLKALEYEKLRDIELSKLPAMEAPAMEAPAGMFSSGLQRPGEGRGFMGMPGARGDWMTEFPEPAIGTSNAFSRGFETIARGLPANGPSTSAPTTSARPAATKAALANQLSAEHPGWSREHIITELNRSFR